jgi:hypothetical protein
MCPLFIHTVNYPRPPQELSQYGVRRQAVGPRRGVFLRTDGWSGDGVGELLLPLRQADEESRCAPINGAEMGSESYCFLDDERTRSLASHRRMERRRGRGAAAARKMSGCAA